jgi:hypothetical protein
MSDEDLNEMWIIFQIVPDFFFIQKSWYALAGHTQKFKGQQKIAKHQLQAYYIISAFPNLFLLAHP